MTTAAAVPAVPLVATPAIAPPPPPHALRRVLGVGFGIAVAVGNMIGAGILRAPADVAARLPSPWLFLGVWVVGGVYALLGANAVAELGAMLPKSGGQYVFARRAFGPATGFVVGWNDWASTCAASAAVAIVFADAFVGLLGTAGRWTMPIALAALAAPALVSLRGIHEAARAQRWTTALKAFVLGALVMACLVARARGAVMPVQSTPRVGITAAAFVLALQGVVFAYDGWVGIAYFSEEVENPGRAIPRALVGGVLSVVALYVAINAAFLAVLSLDALARSALPAADVARAIAGPWGTRLVQLVIVVALPSGLLSNVLFGSRVAYALARDGLAPARLTRVSPRGVPGSAVLVGLAVSVACVLTGTFTQVINVAAFLFVASYVVTFAAVFVLRRREPTLARPYRAWGHPWTTGLVLVACSAFLVGVVLADPRGGALALGIVACAPPVFYALRAIGLIRRD